MDIFCRKLDCKFNDNTVCRARAIKIKDDTICEKYEKIDKTVEDKSKEIFNKTPKFSNYRHLQSIKLCCNANCFFNKSNECFSNGINILVDNELPICGNFLQKTKKSKHSQNNNQ